MTNHKKADPSTLLTESISSITQSATKAFNDCLNQFREDIARAETDARQARNERSQALKEVQRYKDESLEYKAKLKEAELTIKQQRRETIQWMDQAKNWQEHFLRVEQERCSLSSRMDELVKEGLIPPIASNVVSSKPAPSIPHSDQIHLPTYQPPTPFAGGQDAITSQENSIMQQNPRPSRRSAQRKAPRQSELPPYTEVAQTPQAIKAPAPKSATRSSRKSVATPSTHTKPATIIPDSSTPIDAVEEAKTHQGPIQVLIRRVRAVVEVKQEEEEEEDLNELPQLESSQTSSTRRPRNARRARRIVDDEDDYVPDYVSPEIGSREDDEDDELMIGAGDDLSFDVNSSATVRQASGSGAPPNKKRKVDNSKPKGKRKT